MPRMTKDRAAHIIELLREVNPNPKAELIHNNPFELLIAVILSAQTTDKQVNKVTPKLFEKYPAPVNLANAEIEDIEKSIKGIGLYRNKAKNIRQTAAIIHEKYNDEVPQTMDELVTLPGCGRKTANVVLSNAFDVPAIAVDTHVFRVSNRIGLSASKNVSKCEQDLMKKLPKEVWSDAHHLLILHGRYVCKAQRPLCEECHISHECNHYLREERKKERKINKK